MNYLEGRSCRENIIILTSDHGDSLGTDGRWGHEFYLFPENLRVPLIVQVPSRHRASFTSDLRRLAFLNDIAPSLLALLGYEVPNLGSSLGAPLFVAAGLGAGASASRRIRRHVQLRFKLRAASPQRPVTLHGRPRKPRRSSADARSRLNSASLWVATDALRRLSRRAILDGLADIEQLFGLR